MQTTTLHLAIAAAERFIAEASKTQPAISYRQITVTRERVQLDFLAHGKHVAATKRASMDLTRALADLRANR